MATHAPWFRSSASSPLFEAADLNFNLFLAVGKMFSNTSRALGCHKIVWRSSSLHEVLTKKTSAALKRICLGVREHYFKHLRVLRVTSNSSTKPSQVLFHFRGSFIVLEMTDDSLHLTDSFSHLNFPISSFLLIPAGAESCTDFHFTSFSIIWWTIFLGFKYST